MNVFTSHAERLNAVVDQYAKSGQKFDLQELCLRMTMDALGKVKEQAKRKIKIVFVMLIDNNYNNSNYSSLPTIMHTDCIWHGHAQS